MEQVVDLSANGPHLHLRVGQSCRTNHLFDHDASGLRQFVRTGRRGNIDQLIGPLLEFLEREWPIVHGRWQPESVFDKVVLAGAIAVIHAAQLGHRLMALVDEHQRILRQVIEQRWRRLAGQPSGQVAAVVFDAVAVSDFLDHLHVEECALMDALRLQQSSLPLEQRLPALQFFLDRLNRLLERGRGMTKWRLRIDRQAIEQSEFRLRSADRMC